MMVAPQVHLFTDDPGPSYVGCLVSRDFRRGDDAEWAIRGLGYPLSTLPASRVLMVWEQADLLTALNEPHPAQQRAVVILDATVHEYSVTWYPFQAPDVAGSPVGVRWGEPWTADRPALPGPILDVLDTWREVFPEAFADTVSDLVRDGYKFFPLAGPVDPQPIAETVHHAVGEAMATNEPAAIERACQALNDVLAAMPEDDPRRGLYLVDLSLVLQLRHENSGELRDAAEAVRAARKAERYPDGGLTSKRLNALGTAMRIWYERTGESAALTEAITACRDAAAVIPDDDLNYRTCQANLAWALHASFMADGDTANLDAALSAARRAHDAAGSTDGRSELASMTLGVVLQSKYTLTGELATLDEAIELTRSAVTGSASSGWMLSARLTNLGRALQARYLRTGELASLREAVQADHRALAVAPPDHADRTVYQLNLSEALRALSDRTGDLAILDEAFFVARAALKEVPAGHPFRVNHLVNLAIIRQLRYLETADLADLDAARALLRDALAGASSTHPRRPTIMSALGEILDLTSRHTGELGHLDEAMELTSRALDTLAEGHPSRGVVLRTRAEIYQTRHERLGDQAALHEAIALFRAAAADRTSSMQGRVRAARRWGAIAAAAGLTELALDGLANAVELLPLLAARSLYRYDSEYWLSQFGGLASDAAALALEMNSPDRAVELLELGRTVLIVQALEIRTDLSALRDRDARLADRFEWLSARLENDQGDQPDGRRKLADELDAIIARVRAMPGMDRFLLPPSAADLLAQAGQDPVAIVNISAHRCDALVLTRDGLRSQPLPRLTPDAVNEQVGRFLTALATDCRSQFRQARERGEQVLTETLSWLWESVCAPVLDTVDPAPGQRMWWIPTGLLSFLPLHAASGQAPGESTHDRVISSYTPSVRMLAHARVATATASGSGTLVVGMPHTPNAPGLDDLPGALQETSLVAERAPSPHVLIGPEATSTAVAAALQRCAWAHFACHAITATSPSDSHLLLHDHDQRRFTAAAISRLRLDAAAFAYLSACHTAATAANLADEVIHIASAFHMAGYPHVIGTLWDIDDTAATTIAELIYDELTSGHPDPHRAPTALHHAVTRLRQSHPHQPSLWASHIHIGI